jgi:hypothetical protein
MPLMRLRPLCHRREAVTKASLLRGLLCHLYRLMSWYALCIDTEAPRAWGKCVSDIRTCQPTCFSCCSTALCALCKPCRRSTPPSLTTRCVHAAVAGPVCWVNSQCFRVLSTRTQTSVRGLQEGTAAYEAALQAVYTRAANKALEVCVEAYARFCGTASSDTVPLPHRLPARTGVFISKQLSLWRPCRAAVATRLCRACLWTR